MWKWERDTSSACYSFHYRIVKMNAGVWVVTMEVSLNCFCPFKFNSNLITYYIYTFMHVCLWVFATFPSLSLLVLFILSFNSQICHHAKWCFSYHLIYDCACACSLSFCKANVTWPFKMLNTYIVEMITNNYAVQLDTARSRT